MDAMASPIKIAFDAGYLIPVTKQIDGDTITLQSNSPTSAVVITGSSKALFMIMPIHIRGQNSNSISEKSTPC